MIDKWKRKIDEKTKSAIMFEWNTGYALSQIVRDHDLHEQQVMNILVELDDKGWYVHDYNAHRLARGRREWREKQQPIILG